MEWLIGYGILGLIWGIISVCCEMKLNKKKMWFKAFTLNFIGWPIGMGIAIKRYGFKK